MNQYSDFKVLSSKSTWTAGKDSHSDQYNWKDARQWVVADQAKQKPKKDSMKPVKVVADPDRNQSSDQRYHAQESLRDPGILALAYHSKSVAYHSMSI